MNHLKRAWQARRDPLVTDRRYDVACLLTWFFYGVWGVATIFSDRSAFENIEQGYSLIWGGSIGVTAMVACGAATIIFFLNPGNIKSRVTAKRVEIVALCSVLGLLSVYPVTLILTGDKQGYVRVDIIALSFSYFPQAVFRVQHLLARIRQLYRYVPGVNA